MDDLIQIGGALRALDTPTTILADKPGVYIKTFGCQMNVYDSEKLLRLLDNRYRQVDSPEQAQLLLVNTCSVRDKPEQKLYSLLGEYQHLKEINPNIMIGVGGCVAQQEGKNIVKRSKVVNFVFGTHNLSLVPSLIDRSKASGRPQVAIDYRDEWEELPLGLSDASRVSAFVSISRGCNKNCTYCIVPTTRGKEVSRSPLEIAQEVRILVERGAKEIVLLGQTVNSYGLDLQPKMRFSELMERISQIPGVERLRFTSPHPQEVRKDFFELIKSNPKVCHHIHMPLQAGSDRILKLMNRNYRKRRFLEIIDQLKLAQPDIAITTDIIVGFPGETEQEFLETLEVVRLADFDSSYAFVFSPRPGTVAADMDDPIDLETKHERLQRLLILQNEITERRLAAWVGKEVEVLLDGPSKEDPSKLHGRTSQNLVVNLVNHDDLLEPGQLVQVKIVSKARYTLKGEFLSF